jgi:trigger factor
MEAHFEKTGPCLGKLSVKVPATEVEAAFGRVYKNLAKSVRVPGFRPGKAPRHVIDAHYGDQVRSDVENDLVRGSLAKAIEQEKIEPVATPKVETGALEKGAEFSYTAEVETQPVIELKQYDGLEVVKAQTAVDEAALDKELEQLREQAVQLAHILDRDQVQEGDLVLADYEATEGGTPLPGTKAENSILEINKDNDFIPGLAMALVGAKVPSARAVPVDFPADFAIESWRNKKVTFQVQLKELKKKDYPEVDDEFAKDLGEETLEALKGKIRERLSRTAEDEARHRQRKNLLEALIGKNPFDVPPSMISEQVDRMIVDAAVRVRQMMGNRFSLDQLDVEELRRSNRDLAEFNVRSGLLLLEVAKAYAIEISDADIEGEIEKLAAQSNDDVQRVRGHFNRPEERDRIKYRLLEDRTVQRLLSASTMVDGPADAANAANAAKG